MSQLKDLIDRNPAVREAPLRLPVPTGWRAARPGESARQRAERVSRSCCYCGQEFPTAGAELDAHEDEH